MKVKLFLLFLYCLSLEAAQWVIDGNGIWSTDANWSPQPAPNAAGAVAEFTSSQISNDITVTLSSASATIGTLDFDSDHNYTIAAAMAHVLIFDVTSGTAEINVTNTNGNGAHTISAPIELRDVLSINQQSSTTLTLSGEISEVGAKSLEKDGAGTLILTNSANSYSDGTKIYDGVLQVQADGVLGADEIEMTGGTFQAGADNLSFSNAISLSSTEIDTNGFQLTLTGTIEDLAPVQGTLTKIGQGVLTLSTATNTYSAGTIIREGTLSIDSSARIGSGDVTLEDAVLQITSAITISSEIILAGAGTISSTNDVTLSGVVKSTGSLTKAGSGTLTLSGANTYEGGTTISAGTVSVNTDGRLGNAAGPLAIGDGTLSATANFTSSRSITLTGSSIIDTANTLTLSGPITGSGSLRKTNTGTLILTGSNDYSGGNRVSDGGTLRGNTNSLPGDIFVENGTAIFNQTFNGAYSGTLTGPGALTKEGSGLLALTGSSPNFMGATAVTAGNLQVNNSLAHSAVTVHSGATLSGTGTVGTVVVQAGGTLSPGSSIGTLTIDGNLTLNGTSTTEIEISPTSADLIHVTGTATLNGILSIQPESGFYGFSSSHTILTADVSRTGQFSSYSVSNSNFIVTPVYSANAVQLDLEVIQPFLDFPYRNANTRSVGENLNALGLTGAIAADPDLIAVVDSLEGFSVDAINDALDQMHPAQVGAFAELQSAVGAQILTLYHRKPILGCGCRGESQVWAHPFGNWLTEESSGMQLGFHAHTWGIAFGFDTDVSDEWNIGAGGVYNDSHLSWHLDRGSGDTHGLYGALYADFTTEKWYFGTSFLGGMDWYDISRHIYFSTIDRHAVSHTDALDLMGQLSSAYFFGAPSCHLFPFANVDLLYLRMYPFQEKEAQSLNLSVDSYGSLTLRTEAGMGLEIIDRNYEETICFSPLFALGWTMNCPLVRDHFTSTFQGQTISFKTTGWNKTDQLFSLRFGLNLYFHCFVLVGEYVGEFSTDKESYSNQRGNVRLDFMF